MAFLQSDRLTMVHRNFGWLNFGWPHFPIWF